MKIHLDNTPADQHGQGGGVMEIRLDIDVGTGEVRREGSDETIIGEVVRTRHLSRYTVVIHDHESLGLVEPPGPDSPHWPGRQSKP